MSILEIPTRIDASAYKYEIVLDNKLYTFQFAYIERTKRWILNIFDSDKSLLIAGLTLHTNSDLIGRFSDLNLPQGKFICYDTNGENKSADRDDLGLRIKLLYQEAS